MTDNRLIVFTDLDGTLLDHHDYSYVAAEPALGKLRDKRIPLVLASSKTSAEIAPLRKALGFEDSPAIVENGAGILQPCSASVEAADTYDKLLDKLNGLPSPMRANYVGFSDMSVEQVSENTGLPIEDAVRAKAREFSEPGLWNGSDQELDTFLATLLSSGVNARRGGRFLTLSFGANKADRMKEIIGAQQTETGGKPKCIALGDAPNDIEMLEAADHGVIVLNPTHAGLSQLQGEANGQIVRTSKSGPAGWNEAVLALLELYIKD